MHRTAAIVGISGPTLKTHEAALLRKGRPAGVILFGRNVSDPVQLRALTASLRSVLPTGSVLMVDQEGGRVARLRPPHWQQHPSAARIGLLYGLRPEEACRTAWLTGALIGLDCADAGFDVACAPVLDRRLEGRHDVIGDRGYSGDPEIVAVLGREMAKGMLAAGIQPVIKHLPGHGRAQSDSHLSLPIVDDAQPDDLVPFIRNADLPWAMTAHILFPAWDPDLPATLSRKILQDVVRGTIGFGGVLVSDDLAMHALSGTPGDRAKKAIEAGCDLAMYCAGDGASSADVLDSCPGLTADAISRLENARVEAHDARQTLNAVEMAAERNSLLS